MSKKFKILFLGDIVGRSGRQAVKKFLDEGKENFDFVIANVENASHGFGLTKKNHDELFNAGINCMTSGNHIWDKKDILAFINESECLIRPYNYHDSTKGVGFRIFDDKIIVINLLGKTFMPQIHCPFLTLEKLIGKLKRKFSLDDKIIIVDFHAEATAEKECMGIFAQRLKVKALIGTHTHVQTADEKIVNETLAYITDVGSCSSTKGVIGMDYESSYKRLVCAIPERFEVETEAPFQINAVEMTFDYSKGTPLAIKRINIKYNKDDN